MAGAFSSAFSSAFDIGAGGPSTSVAVFAYQYQEHSTMYLRQSTASQEILLGPFVDSTDGVTAETGLTIANTDIKIWKGGTTSEVDKNSGGATHIASGRYSVVLDATDTNTVGMLEINVAVAGALPVRRQFYVLEEAVFDQIMAASAAGYQVPIWSSAGATVNLSGTTVNTLTSVAANGITAASIASDAITAAKIAADAIGASELATDAITEIVNAVWSAATRVLTAGTNIVLAKGTGITGFNDPTTAAIADAVWDEPLAGHTTSSTYGLILADGAADALEALGLTQVLHDDWVNGGRLDLLLDAVKLNTDKLGTAMVLDGAVWQFTVNALELAPSGGGGGSTDWNADERTAIRAILGIPGSGTTPADPTTGILDTIRDRTLLLSTQTSVDGMRGATFDTATDSLEAIRNRGDAAWVTGSGGGGGGGGAYPSIYAPPHPTAIYMASDIFTYADMVYRLLAKRGLTGSSREMYMLRIAVQDALTELAGRAHWRHYQRRVAVTTEQVSQYANTSFVASTGLITISTGSWPTSAAFGEIVYGEHRYKVVSRNSSTELLLSSVTAPAANFTGTVTWMRPSYTLPFQIKQIRSVMDEDASRPLEYMDPVEAIRHRKLARTTGQSLRYTVRPSENYMGLMEIEFSPVPATAKRFEIGMVIRPRPFSTFELTGTDGAYTSGSYEFTSASANFTSQHVGCILRISPSSTLPKGRTQFDDARSDYAIQTFIKSVTNATTVVVTEAFTTTGSAKGYTVSDPADINPLTMLSALEALAWEKYCHNHEQATELLPAAIRLAKLEFDRGMDADLATSAMMSPTDYDYHGFNDFEPNVNVLGG
jgi:hypothetical protein